MAEQRWLELSFEGHRVHDFLSKQPAINTYRATMRLPGNANQVISLTSQRMLMFVRNRNR